MREKNMTDIRKRIALTFSNRQFKKNVERSEEKNWLQIDAGAVFRIVQEFWESMNA